MSPNHYDTIIIGGGPAGIASALRRRKRGEKVLLLEKNDHIGGKLDVYEWEGYRWDKGPSLFTLPKLVDELFELYGKNPKDYFNYQLIDENCRYYFPDGTHFIFHSDPIRRQEALADFFTEQEVEKVEKYIKKIANTYEAIGDLFIAAPKRGFTDLFKGEILKQYPKFASRQMLLSLNRYNERMLGNEKLVQLFNRFGTYNGSNPYKMSGLYSMIPHLELNIGTYFPIGGMRAIIDSLEILATEVGIEIRRDEPSTKVIKSGDKFDVHLMDDTVTSDQLICAIDHVNFYQDVMPDDQMIAKHQDEERSTTAVVFYWAIEGNYPEIGLHNILFSADYPKEFHQLFDLKVIPDDPTFYIHNSSAVEDNAAPKNGQNWFVMINAPAGTQPSDEELERLRSQIKARVKKHINIDLTDKILHEERWDMQRIRKDTGSFMGSLYGASFNTKTSSFTRHGNKSKKHKNLYFAGGSVHPGGGIPLVLNSAKIVDELMEKNG
ncbi:MAG: phytoene desaturase [Arenicella sp.]|jgi:phytoene desaturase